MIHLKIIAIISYLNELTRFYRNNKRILAIKSGAFGYDNLGLRMIILDSFLPHDLMLLSIHSNVLDPAHCRWAGSYLFL